MTSTTGQQILKSRDDHSIVALQRLDSSPEPRFTLSADATCSWAKAGEDIRPDRLRARIEPWLTALAQSEHLSLLIGSGLTRAVHRIATDADLPGMQPIPFGIFDDEISAEAKRIAEAAGRQAGNFEDQLRVATDLLRAMEMVRLLPTANDHPQDAHISSLKQGVTAVIQSFTASLFEGERNLALAASVHRERAFNYLVSFLMSFASRSGTRDRLHLFTTNYDRYLEAGADVAGLRLIDRFVGTLGPVFRASRLDIDFHYNPPGIRGEPRYLEGVARFTKLHGSVDWIDLDGAIRRIGIPFGATAIPDIPTLPPGNVDALRLMIYPNAAKDRETTYYPYVELFRDLAAAICRPNSTLLTYGYGFGDEHINRVIADMLTIPSTHLVVIAHGDPLGRIMRLYDKLGRQAQTTLLIGDHLGDLQALVDHYLPKPAIDRATFRMTELLRARWGTDHTGRSPTDNVPGPEEPGS